MDQTSLTRCLCDVYISEKVTLHSDIIGFNILQFSPFSFNIIFSLTFFSHQLLPSILTFALVSFVPCHVLVVPCLQMAHSDHLLMTVEHRKGVPAAAAWHPAQRAHTHLLSHTSKYKHTFRKRSYTHSLHFQALLQIQNHPDKIFIFFCSVTHLSIALISCQP